MKYLAGFGNLAANPRGNKGNCALTQWRSLHGEADGILIFSMWLVRMVAAGVRGYGVIINDLSLARPATGISHTATKHHSIQAAEDGQQPSRPKHKTFL